MASNSNALMTPLCYLLGCRYPIVQTAMGWVADEKLVAASCNAGAFGFLAAATIEPDKAETVISHTRQLTTKPFGINFHMFQPNAEELIDLSIQYGIRAVSYGRAPKAAFIQKLKDAKILCMPTVGALKHAKKAVALGADIITIQGGEGGGHTGAVSTIVLLKQVLDADLEVPIVVAGGISDGRALAAMLVWGAAGVAMGTRFLLTKDSPVPDITKTQYIQCAEPATMKVSKVLDGLPQRIMANPLISRIERGLLLKLWIAIHSAWQYKHLSGASFLTLFRTALAMRKAEGISFVQAAMSANAPMLIQRAMVDGVPDEGVLPGGQIAATINTLPSCAELITTMIADANSALAKFSKL